MCLSVEFEDKFESVILKQPAARYGMIIGIIIVPNSACEPRRRKLNE
jgi:hypothetical protein